MVLHNSFWRQQQKDNSTFSSRCGYYMHLTGLHNNLFTVSKHVCIAKAVSDAYHYVLTVAFNHSLYTASCDVIAYDALLQTIYSMPDCCYSLLPIKNN